MIMISGGVFNDHFVPYVQVDAFGRPASGEVALSKKWLGIGQQDEKRKKWKKML